MEEPPITNQISYWRHSDLECGKAKEIFSNVREIEMKKIAKNFVILSINVHLQCILKGKSCIRPMVNV